MSGLTIAFTGLRKQYHNLREEILAATDEVLRSGQLMNGNHTAEFENWLAKRNHSRYAVCVHSGTSALECIAEYYRSIMLHNPSVLIPSLTYAATANAFVRAGWDVEFADTDNHGLLDTRRIPDLSKFNAVIMIGLYGANIEHMSDSRAFKALDLNNLLIIEDAAQHWLSGTGARIGVATAISFDPMKNLPCYGNGGAVVTNDFAMFQFAQSWRDNGKSSHAHVGTNSRMSEIDCAQLLVKTKYIDDWQRRRRRIASYWIERLEKSSIRCLIDRGNIESHAIQKFVIDCDDRNELQKHLSMKKIETRIHYSQPLHEIGIFRQYPGPDILSSSSALSRRVLSLPIYPELTDLEVEYIIDQVVDFAESVQS